MDLYKLVIKRESWRLEASKQFAVNVTVTKLQKQFYIKDIKDLQTSDK